jgi:hypothetical protein
VVFPLLHGPFGEDGTIQGLLEMAGVRYVGAGVLASAVGMDKHYMKLVFQTAGLPVTPYTVVTPRQWREDKGVVREAVASLGYPVFVKPARAGSSFGISKVHDESELDDAVEEARRHDPKVLVEAFAAGAREVECGVLQYGGDEPPQASVVGEIKVGGEHEFYDFAAKYLPEEATELDVPADIGDEVSERVRELAVRAFEAIGADGAGRLLRARRRRRRDQRDQHHARLHADLDVPAVVGRDRDRLPRAGRPADHAGRTAAARPALTAPGPCGPRRPDRRLARRPFCSATAVTRTAAPPAPARVRRRPGPPARRRPAGSRRAPAPAR